MSALVQPSEIHRVSIDEYHRMVASGGLSEETHVELINGWVVDMSPRSPEHENAIEWLIDWLAGALDRRHLRFRVTGSMTIGDSEPEPDVAIIDRAPPQRAHPSRARLVIEVALTSRDRDLIAKPAVYAPAVDEYWVIDLERSVIVLHRQSDGTAYRTVSTAARGESVEPVALTLAPLDTDALFAAALAEGS